MAIAFSKASILGLTLALSAIATVPAEAASFTYSLVKKSVLTNVNDAEGRWQFDGGDVYLNGTRVGYYVRKKRVSFGVPASVNKSAMEMTIIWGSGAYNFTVQGEHSFTTGKELGGVSATSAGFTYLSDATFTGSPTSITVTY